MSLAEASNLSLYSMLIIDGENMVNNPNSLTFIKKLNKNIKLICYSNPMEIFSPMAQPRPLQSFIAKEIKEKYPQWLLKNNLGENVVYYPGMIMLNLSSNCPRINGKNCVEYLVEKQLNILKNEIWDGYFMDNGGANISWVNKQIDSDNNGIKDMPLALDSAWSKGIFQYLSLIKKGLQKDKILLANKGSLSFVELVDGKMFEKFPNNYLGSKRDYGWHKCMANALETGAYTIYLVEPRNLMFGLASALLTDNVYLAIGQDNPKIHSELQIDLGKPLEAAYKEDTCYYRNFERGTVKVIPSIKKGIISRH
jgi:hypothetical protein